MTRTLHLLDTRMEECEAIAVSPATLLIRGGRVSPHFVPLTAVAVRCTVLPERRCGHDRRMRRVRGYRLTRGRRHTDAVSLREDMEKAWETGGHIEGLQEVIG